MTAWLIPMAVGFGTGILSAWGVGGGTLLLLIMTLFLGVDPSTARAINLLYFLPTAGISLLFHSKNDLLDRKALRHAIPPGIVTAAAVGSFLKSALQAGGALQQSFGGLETIYKSRKEVGGPLEQFCTIGRRVA